ALQQLDGAQVVLEVRSQARLAVEPYDRTVFQRDGALLTDRRDVFGREPLFDLRTAGNQSGGNEYERNGGGERPTRSPACRRGRAGVRCEVQDGDVACATGPGRGDQLGDAPVGP